MRKRCCNYIKLMMLSILVSYTPAGAQNWNWTQTTGGDCKSDAHTVNSDPAGNVYVYGYFYPASHYSHDATLTIGKFVMESSGNFLAKYDRDGQVLWATLDSNGSSIALNTLGNLYKVGTHKNAAGSELFLEEYNSDGGVIWTKTILTGRSFTNTMLLVDANNNFFVNGYIQTSLGTKTVDSAFLLKCDSAGSVVWKKSFSSNINFQKHNSIATDSSCNLYVSGIFYDSIKLGDTILTCDSQSATFLAKYDGNGKLAWIRNSQIHTNYVYLTADPAGYTYQTGDFYGSAVFGNQTVSSSGNVAYIVKYDKSGEVLWIKHTRSDGHSYPFDVTVDPSGNVYFTGWFSNTISFDSTTLNANSRCSKLFLYKLDQAGNVKWAFSENAECSVGSALFADENGNCYLAGQFFGNMQLGSNSIKSNSSGYTMFVGKFEGDPMPLKNDNEVLLYPNPASSYMMIRGGKSVLISHVSIIDMSGKKIYECYQDENDWIRISGLVQPDGVYMLRADGNGKTFTIPFSIKN